jgi:hypothetical protein
MRKKKLTLNEKRTWNKWEANWEKKKIRRFIVYINNKAP